MANQSVNLADLFKSNFSDEHRKVIVKKLLEEFQVIKEHYPCMELDGIADSYFIFSQDVLYFHSAKNQAWRFGLWAKYGKTEDELSGIIYFGEAWELINKFKPTATSISTEDRDEFFKKIEIIHDKPIQSFVAAMCGFPFDFPAYKDGEYPVGYQVEYNAETDSYWQDFSVDKETFIQKHFKEHWANKRLEQQNKQKCYYFLLKEIPQKLLELPFVKNIGIYDGNYKTGLCSSPRYDLIIQVSINYHAKLKKKLGSERKSFDFMFSKIHEICNWYNEAINELVLEDSRYVKYEYRLHRPRKLYFTDNRILSYARYKWGKNQKKKKFHKRNRQIARWM